MKEEKEEKEEEDVGEEREEKVREGEEVEEEVEVVEEEEPAPPPVSPTCSLPLSLENNLGLHPRTTPRPTHQPGYGCRASARCDITPPRLLLPVSRPRSHVCHHRSKHQYD